MPYDLYGNDSCLSSQLAEAFTMPVETERIHKNVPQYFLRSRDSLTETGKLNLILKSKSGGGIGIGVVDQAHVCINLKNGKTGIQPYLKPLQSYKKDSGIVPVHQKYEKETNAPVEYACFAMKEDDLNIMYQKPLDVLSKSLVDSINNLPNDNTVCDLISSENSGRE